jgi:predicted transcriptional regulator
MQTTDAKAIRTVDHVAVERIYARALWLQQNQIVSAAEKGMRVARSGNSTMLRTLEACAEQMEAIEENQRGRTRRTSKDAHRAKSHEASIFREAYRLADKGSADKVFAFVYAAAAEHAGVIEMGARV